jgi:hypothetical protein
MDKKFFGLLLAITIGLAACNDDADNKAANDSTDTSGTTATTTETTTTTSSTDYAALGEEYRTNSEAGNYLDPKTGKKIRISVDPSTGTRYNAETGEPVWRYVDRRTWWLYGGDNWDKVGEVKMEGNTLRYKGDNDAWVTYDERYPNDAAEMKTWKERIGDTKYKVDKDGDIKIKNKETGEKIKYDADDNKVKVDSAKH